MTRLQTNLMKGTSRMKINDELLKTA